MNLNKTNNKNRILYAPQIGIGDLVFSIPLLHSLRKAYPNYELTVPIVSSEQKLASKSLKNLFKNLVTFYYASINEELDKERREIYRSTDYEDKFIDEFEKRKKFEKKVFEFYLKNENFSIAILPRRFKIDSIVCQNQINLEDLPYVSKSHMVERNLKFADYLGIEKIMSFELNLDINKGVKNNKGDIIKLPEKLVTIILSAGRPRKKWDLKNYQSVCDFIQNRGYIPVLIGSPFEYEGVKNIEKPGVISLVQKNGFFIDLENSARLLALSTAVVGGDTGLTHLADAVRTKVIGLYGPTRPHKFAPYNNKELVLSTNHTTKLMKDIKPEEVICRLEKILV